MRLFLLPPFQPASLGLAVAIATGSALAAPDERPLIDDEVPTISRYDQGELRLDDVKSGYSLQQGPGAVNPLRAEALKESAQAYGARAGLYARMREINQMLDAEASRLSSIFPFAPLMLAHNVLPPVIQRGHDTVRKTRDAQLRFADAVFEIVAPAKLAVTPPDWRTYLYIQAARPEPPDETLLPDRSQAAEVALWERYVERGWRHGIRQANRTFEVQLNRLERDLLGMAQYRQLLAKSMVTAPRLTEQWRGVIRQGNTLFVNDRVLEIAENTRFVTENQRWKPYPTRPYRPSKRAPKINLRVLKVENPPMAEADPPPPTFSAVAPVTWEMPLWQR